MKKRMKKIILAVLAVIVAVCAGMVIFLYCSPMPGVLLLRHAFGGEGDVQNPPDYAEKKAKITIQRDLEYSSEDGRNQYDLYLPENASEPLPVIVWVHGGAFVAGDKSGVENWAVMLAKEGAPLDMSAVILAGDSAGAHIAAQAGLLATNPAYAEELGVASALDKEDLKAMLLYCGPYNVEQILKVDDPLMQFFASRIGWAMLGDKHWQEGDAILTTTIKNYITEHFPPSYIADGNTGSFEKDGKELAAELKQKQVMVRSLFFEAEQGEIGHEYQFNLSSEEGMHTLNETVQFLSDIMD